MGMIFNWDVIGVKIYVIIGGVIQLWEQNGGFYCWFQNFKCIYFGLVFNMIVDIIIEWFFGQVDIYIGFFVD